MSTLVKDISYYYQTQGYYIFRKLIPDDVINSFLEEYNSSIVHSKALFYRQSTRYQSNQISEYGYVVNPFMDIHCYDYPDSSKYGCFSKAIRQILCSQKVREALTQLTGNQQHNLMQSMLFDMNAATPCHQDCYYLDSIPPGHLLAGWFALEDIHEEAGRFYVFPKSHTVNFDLTDEEKRTNNSYVSKLKHYEDLHRSEIYAPALQKGDVLFWNSHTIHGSLKTLNREYSRKSLTAHYLPNQYHYGNLYTTAPITVNYATHEGMNYRVFPRSTSPYIHEHIEKIHWYLRTRRTGLQR